MTQIHLPSATTLLCLATMLVSCGPETNSRYGDAYWDPNETKEQFDPIEVPDFTVTYKNVAADGEEDDFDAYIAFDFTDLDRESKDGVVMYYTRGISGEKDIADLLQADSNFSDSSFLNDLENGIDYRLLAAQTGEYTIVMDFDVIWPNGNTVSYAFDDIEFTVPGCQLNYDFYTDYVNPVLAENCVSCHSSIAEATAVLTLSASDVDERRDNFIAKIPETGLPAGAGSMTMLQYIFDESHTGYSTAIGITGDELDAFVAYSSQLRSIDIDTEETRDITADFTFTETDAEYEFCLAQPSTFVVEES